MKRKFAIIVAGLTGAFIACQAQTSSNALQAWFNSARDEANKEYEEYRNSALQEYADMLEQAWSTYEAEAPTPVPKEPKVEPKVYTPKPRPQVTPQPQPVVKPQPQPQPDVAETPEKEVERQRPVEGERAQGPEIGRIPTVDPTIGFDPNAKPVLSDLPDKEIERERAVEGERAQGPEIGRIPTIDPTVGFDPNVAPVFSDLPDKEIERYDPLLNDRPIPFDQVISLIPMDVPQPQPANPVFEMPPIDNSGYESTIDFTFFGTPASVRFDPADAARLNGTDERAIAQYLRDASSESYNNMLYDCLELRDRLHLSDWAYLNMVKAMSEKLYGGDTNEARLLTAAMLFGSGFKIRIGRGVDDGRVHLLYASQHSIFAKRSFWVGAEKFYCSSDAPQQMLICDAIFPGEQSLSLLINKTQAFEEDLADERTVKSRNYEGFTVTYAVNRNLIDFYNTYPSSVVNNDLMTKWTQFANAPLDESIRESLYPQLRQKFANLSKLDCVNRLLNMIQFGLEYEYDENVWGDDRTFFAEETLFYPFCDCEDRSILLTRIARDVLDLDCILVYYPGHMASAIEFPGEEVHGDYIALGNRKFYIADATYIGAPVGTTMEDMDNATAKVVLLNR